MDKDRLDRITERAGREREARKQSYRDKALKLLPWICGRCTREFTRANVHELTVHHIDHDHHNNPDDGSNWELLCLYCHDNEHQRELEGSSGQERRSASRPAATHQPFAGLDSLFNGSED